MFFFLTQVLLAPRPIYLNSMKLASSLKYDFILNKEYDHWQLSPNFAVDVIAISHELLG